LIRRHASSGSLSEFTTPMIRVLVGFADD